MTDTSNLISFADAWGRRSEKFDTDFNACRDLVGDFSKYYDGEGRQSQAFMSAENS